MHIEIQKRDTGWFVRCGERWEDRLDTGEALYCVARLMITGKTPYLKNGLEHALWDGKYGYYGPALLAEKVAP